MQLPSRFSVLDTLLVVAGCAGVLLTMLLRSGIVSWGWWGLAAAIVTGIGAAFFISSARKREMFVDGVILRSSVRASLLMLTVAALGILIWDFMRSSDPLEPIIENPPCIEADPYECLTSAQKKQCDYAKNILPFLTEFGNAEITDAARLKMIKDWRKAESRLIRHGDESAEAACPAVPLFRKRISALIQAENAKLTPDLRVSTAPAPKNTTGQDDDAPPDVDPDGSEDGTQKPDKKNPPAQNGTPETSDPPTVVTPDEEDKPETDSDPEGDDDETDYTGRDGPKLFIQRLIALIFNLSFGSVKITVQEMEGVLERVNEVGSSAPLIQLLKDKGVSPFIQEQLIREIDSYIAQNGPNSDPDKPGDGAIRTLGNGNDRALCRALMFQFTKDRKFEASKSDGIREDLRIKNRQTSAQKEIFKKNIYDCFEGEVTSPEQLKDLKEKFDALWETL